MTVQQALRSHAQQGINPATIREHLLVAAERIDYLEQQLADRSPASIAARGHRLDVSQGPYDVYRVYSK